MRAIPARKVHKVLRNLGLKPLKRGDGTGHEVWVDQYGHTCRPSLHQKDVAFAVLYSLGTEIETKGIAARRALFAALRGA